MNLTSSRPGLSIVVVSFRRTDALYANLTSLLSQDLTDLPYEIVVINNAPEVQFRPGRWSKLGRLFRANPHIKLVNSGNYWKHLIRYGMVYLAYHDTVLILDDDLILLDQCIARDMYHTLASLQKYDIVSSWNTLWTKWTETQLHYASAKFLRSDWTQLTKYAMPMYGRVDFHPEHKKNALHMNPRFYADRLRRYKHMLQNGYKPVIARELLADDSPEMRLFRQQVPKVRSW